MADRTLFVSPQNLLYHLHDEYVIVLCVFFLVFVIIVLFLLLLLYIYTIAFIICVFYSLRGLFHYFLLFLLVDFLQTLYNNGVSMQEFVNLFWSELFAPL